MSTPDPFPDDPLARAQDALRQTPVPTGPSEEAVARTLAALDAAAQRPNDRPFRLPWRPTMGLVLKTAAAVIAAVGGLFYLAGNPSSATLLAFAETAEKLRDAHTLDYRLSVTIPGQKGPMKGREYYKDPGLTRTEFELPQAVATVTDVKRGKLLSLDPSAKTALLQDWKPTDEQRRRLEDRATATIEHLRALAGKPGKPVGKRRIGDVDAQGVRVESDGQEWTVWIDPARRLPLIVETTFRMQDKEIATSMSDFRVDPELDDALFRLDPPEGYTLQKIDGAIPMREEAVINLLRAYADGSAGAFPARIDDGKAYQKLFPKDKPQAAADPKTIRLVQSLAAAIVFLQFELKGKYGYQPQGAKLGDADKIVFWYKPQGADRYRAIYGDLHTADVTAEQVPAAAKP